MLWPATASGSTPRERHSAARPSCSVPIATCATSVSCRRLSPSGAASWSATDQPASSRTIASHAATSSRTTGSRSISSRPMPVHWQPWPLKTNATRGAEPVAAGRDAAGAVAADRSLAASSPRSRAAMASRCG